MSMRTGFILVLFCTTCLLGLDARGQDTLGVGLQGTVHDRMSGTPIVGAYIELYGTDGSQLATFTNDLGFFTFDAPDRPKPVRVNTTYSIQISAEDHFTSKDQITTVGLAPSKIFVKEYFLAPVRQRTGCGVPTVFFEPHEAALDQEGLATLDQIVDILKNNPNAILAVHGHCNADEDTTLATVRAQVVVNHLTHNGIESPRLDTHSHGSRDPLVQEVRTIKNARMTDAEVESIKRYNRRVEFGITSLDYKK